MKRIEGRATKWTIGIAGGVLVFAGYALLTWASAPVGVTPTTISRGTFERFKVKTDPQATFDFMAQAKPAMDMAIASFEDAARKGDAEAGWNVGLGCLRGIGVVKDETKAAEWFKKAANLGDIRAQTALSDLYFTGGGVQRDYVRAYTWANIAARSGQEQDERLTNLRRRMITAQLEDANHHTAVWFAHKSKP